MSPRHAAGILPIRTVGQPGPVITPPCAVESPNRAAGFPIDQFSYYLLTFTLLNYTFLYHFSILIRHSGENRNPEIDS
jgi:hypothetical protein